MEMATQAKTTNTTTTTAAVKVKAATGNGNPYTQNISTVKKRKLQTVNCFRKSSTRRTTTARTTAAAYCSKIQNNKTEIKISKYKQRNYLKFLIKYLYLKLKLILCISQINKSIFKLHKTKINTNNNYNKTFETENCIINLRQQQQQQQQHKQQLLITSFKTFTFKFNNVLNFLTKFNYYCSPQTTKLEKYVKILLKYILHNKILKHFVGICPKRLISLKRLKQIPENHAKIENDNDDGDGDGDDDDDETLIKPSSKNYVKPERPLRKVIKLQGLKSRSKLVRNECKGNFAKSIHSKRENVLLQYCQLIAKDTNNKMNCQLRLCKETHTCLIIQKLKTSQNLSRKERPISKNQHRNLKPKFSPLKYEIEAQQQQIMKKLVPHIWSIEHIKEVTELLSKTSHSLKDREYSPKHPEELKDPQIVLQTYQTKDYKMGSVPLTSQTTEYQMELHRESWNNKLTNELRGLHKVLREPSMKNINKTDLPENMENSKGMSYQPDKNTNYSKIQNPQTVFQLNSFKNGDLLKTTKHKGFKQKLADNTNFAKQILSNNNNFHKNSRHKESKQQKFLQKCQHFLSTILLYYCCSCYCIWHIYGFPLVLVKIFKYLKDSTVHVLTRRRLKIATLASSITTSAATTTTSIVYNDSNFIAACVGKLKKPTKMAGYKSNNQQNVLKRQTTHKTTVARTITTTALRKAKTFVGTCAHSSSSCSTTSLTGSSAYSSSPENLILQQEQQQSQQTWTPYCYYQQQPHLHQRHHHHQQQQEQELLPKQQQLLRCYQPTLPHSQPHYNTSTNSFLHLPQPSLLAFSRTLIILILLSSLWHTSEGFHGSGVKLSTNTVKTKYGLVRGIVVRSSPSLVEAYLGIPYASPPVGSLRFMPPITPSTWKNVRNADRFSPVCPQNVPIPPNGPEALLEVPRARLAQLRRLLPLLSNQSEDCLYLNIYVPYEHRRHRRFTTNSGELNDTPKLPIILFIHGESYEWNSGNPYDGSELAAHGNVIVVTINFRLGIFGFLKTGGKESAQGNFGLMDLVAGLHWLRENLPAFGGDPQAITLLGHGTGAALANILVVSPVSSDLIQHTVLVSGSALSPWAIQKNPLFVKRRVAEQTGCHGDMLYYDLAPCLRTKTVAELLAVKIDHPRFLVGFAPFIDGTVISPNTDSIGKLSLPLGSAIVSTSGIEYANFPKRNLIFCLTSVESHLDLSAQDLEFGFNETRRDRILRTYVRNNFHYHLNEIFAVLKNEYTDWDKAIRSPLSSRDATLQFLSDGHTASSLIKLGYMHSLRGGRGYFLHFKHRTVEEEYPQRTGSVRGEDVPFWLGLPISPLFPHNYTTQEKQISRLMLRYLANFAKTGNPNQSSLSTSGQPSSSSLIGSPSSASSSPSSASSSRSQTADDAHEKVKRSSFNIVNATTSSSSSSSASQSSGPIKSNAIVVDVETAAAREALNLAVLYNQRRTKRTYYKRHSRSNDDHSGSASSEVNYFLSLNNNNNNNNKLDGDELPFWDAYDVVNQLYMELGNKAEIQSHYRGHKLSMWLNLIPQLHRHANMNDQSMRHHQFQDDLNNLNLYEGIVRAQIQTKPDDDDETILLPKGRPTPPPVAQETNTTQKPNGGTTECGVDGAMFVAEMTTIPPSDNRSLVLDSREKEMATASTGLIGNLEVLRRLSGKQFQSYTTALVATVAVGCFLLILNILIFAGIYHQREKRARDAKTKEELQDNDTSKNSSMLKLNALGSETGSFNGSGAGVSGKTTVVFGEYSCYDEKSLQTKDEKLMVELPPPQMIDPNWPACSTSTLDLLKTKHHTPLDTTYTLSNVVPINTESQTDHLMAVNAMEMSTYNPLPMTSGLIIDPTLATANATSSSGLLSKRGSFVGSASQLNQYDFASVQSSDQMSFKDIENAVKASATMDDDITHDDDIPEPPPPPRSFHNMQQQQQQQQQQQGGTNVPAAASGSGGGGGILRQAGTTSSTQTGGGKKRVHIQEISV